MNKRAWLINPTGCSHNFYKKGNNKPVRVISIYEGTDGDYLIVPDGEECNYITKARDLDFIDTEIAIALYEE